MSTTLHHSPRRIFIDATYTVCSGRSSGIERVVRNLIRECEAIAETGIIRKPTIVASHGGQFYALSEKSLHGFQRTARMQANVLATVPRVYRTGANHLCQRVSSKTARKWLLPQPGHLGVFKLLHTLRQRAVFQDLARRTAPVEARQGDLFILPDAYWVKRLRTSVWSAANQVRAQQGSVASIIYDLIPLTHPQFVGHKRRDAFYDYLIRASRNSDLLVTISNTVKQQLQEFLDSQSQLKAQPALRSFQLGAELQVAEGQVRNGVKEVFSANDKTPYLMVATFDPRKNHHYLLDAFELLWQSGQQLDLCLVGRIGSRCDQLLERISNHPQLGKRLHVFDDLSDAELHHCYGHSRGVIFPSIVEGFGLPIVESLWYGNKTFVSDTPIHREVGQDDCCYFNLDCPSSLATQLTQWEQRLSNDRLSKPTRRPVSWTHSCQQFLEHCFDLFHDDCIHARGSAA